MSIPTWDPWHQIEIDKEEKMNLKNPSDDMYVEKRGQQMKKQMIVIEVNKYIKDRE